MAIDDNTSEHPTPITKYGVISIISASALDRHLCAPALETRTGYGRDRILM
jgi:hypothetical protein